MDADAFLKRFTNSTYTSWSGMIHRCCDPNHWKFKNYGGRGITVIPRWHKFENFVRDMGPRPEGLTLDRLDNNGSYRKSNCRWATRREQSLNRSNTRIVTIDGVTRPLLEFTDERGIPYKVVWNRIVAGWSVEKALNTPRRPWQRKSCPPTG